MDWFASKPWILAFSIIISARFLPAHAVDPTISGIHIEADGRARVTVAADAESYYILYRGEALADIRILSQLDLGKAGVLELTDASAPAPAIARFYRVEQVPLGSAKDSDNDGIDDVFELYHRTFLDPLVKVDVTQDTDGDGISDLEEYKLNSDPFAANATAPKVSLASPTLGAAYFAPGYVTLEARAHAGGANATLTKVEFFANTNKIGDGSLTVFGGVTNYVFKWDAVPMGEYVLLARATDSQGVVAESIPTPIRVVNLEIEPLATVTSSPAGGETGVAVTRETILRFSCPLRDDAVLDSTRLYAIAAGRKILSRVELSTDHRTATLFYLENLPASSRVRVTLEGGGLYDCLGREIDADGNGLPGGTGKLEFDTLTTAEVPRTAVIGRVFASEPVPGATTTNFVNRPLKGVTITVDGAEQTLRTTTDSQGAFRLEPVPAGRFFVHVDGRTAEGSQWPDGAYYPFVGKAWEAVAGRTDNLAGGSGEIYLPLVPGDALKPVSATEDTTIKFSPAILAANPALAGVSITVPANSLFDDNGARGGRVGIAPVSPDRLPEPLPAGLEFPLVITIQTDGPRNFDRPVPVCFPNLSDPGTGQPLPPGTKNWLFSFSHDTGAWEPIGPMTVTADGKFICTDPGVGVIQPGWHGSAPAPDGPQPCGSSCCFNPAPPPPPPGNGNTPSGVPQSNNYQPSSGQNASCKPECKPDAIGLAKCLAKAEAKYAACSAACGQFFLTCEAGTLGIGTEFCLPALVACVGYCTWENYDDVVECTERFGCSKLSRRSAVERAGLSEIDPTAEQILDNIDAIIELTKPFPANTPVPAEIADKVRQLLKESLDLAGGDAPKYLEAYAARLELEAASIDIEFATSSIGNAPAYPVRYVVIGLQSGKPFRLSGWTDPLGKYRVFLPRNVAVDHIGFYDSKTHAYGMIHPYVSPSAPYRFPRFTLYQIGTELPDSDNDSVPDAVEEVYGSNPYSTDSDGDGVPDGDEVAAGTNPTDGQSSLSGVVASLPVAGTAVDVSAAEQLVAVAAGSVGMSVFNTLNSASPVLTAQVDTPGTCVAVSLSGTWIAAADSEAGLALIDIRDPANARIIQQVNAAQMGGGSAQAVTTAAGLAFVGTTVGNVALVEIASGAVFQVIDLGARVEDLVVEGTTLFAYAGNKVHVLPFDKGVLERAGVADCPSPIGINSANGRGRLFVGGGIAYATHAMGYNTVDVRDLTNPRLLAQGTSTQFGWKQAVANGSGRVVATFSPNQGFDGPHDVGLFDSSDLSAGNMNDKFLTQFETTGIARAVTLYNGLAYVADHDRGLAVINYLPPDTAKKPPTGKLEQSVTNEVTIGGFVVLRAAVQDDGQVRNVEFYANGQRVAVDGNFPFEHIYRVPTNTVGASIVFSVLATDMAGNRLAITNSPITTTPDTQAPGVSIVLPVSGARFTEGERFFVQVSTFDNADGVQVSEITLQIDGAPPIGRRLNRTDFEVAIPPTLGRHILRALARDSAGNEAISAEVEVFTYIEAVSREWSVYVGTPDDSGPEAISREFSVYVAEPESAGPEAVSREFSVYVGQPETDFLEAISREFSIFVGADDTRLEAISRETSVEVQPAGSP